MFRLRLQTRETLPQSIHRHFACNGNCYRALLVQPKPKTICCGIRVLKDRDIFNSTHTKKWGIPTGQRRRGLKATYEVVQYFFRKVGTCLVEGLDKTHWGINPHYTARRFAPTSNAIHFVTISLDKIHRVKDNKVITSQDSRNLGLNYFVSVFLVKCCYIEEKYKDLHP